MPLFIAFRKHALRWAVVCVSIMITLSLASYHAFQAQSDQKSFIKRLDYLFYDWRYNLGLNDGRFPRSDANIVIVDIDEKSLAKDGRWPWTRDKLARMVDHLVDAGAIVIGFDVLLTEPQNNPTRVLQDKARENGREDIAQELNSFIDETEYDQILANSFTNVDIVLPFLFHDNQSIQVGQLPDSIYQLTSEQAEQLLAIMANGYTASVPILQNAAVGAGFIVPSIDGDGVLRSASIVQRFGNDIYPSLSLAMGMAYMFLDEIDITIKRFNQDLTMISKINFTNKSIFTDFKGKVLVPYIGPQGSYPYLSASDVLSNNFDHKKLENALVLVGTSSVGLADLRATPIGTQYPGVEIHANLLNGLLSGSFPVEPADANLFTAAILLILGFLYTVFSSRLGPFQLMLATLMLLTTLVSINLFLWFAYNASLPMASSFLLTLALGTLHLLEGFLSERRAKQYVTNIFGQYVPSAHISKMLAEPGKYSFEGETREMTVLFADIRSFTGMSENLSATELKDLLNRYFTPITETIFNHQGTVDKYVGDMVMAFWGAPIADSQHALHALEASIEMLNVLNKLNPTLTELGYAQIKIGIGLNSGLMNVGDMGSSFRKAYTVLGDAVNLGSRLESLTKYYDTDILVGPQTKAECGTWAFRIIDNIQVKGKIKPVTVYEPVCPLKELSDQEKKELTKHEDAVYCYKNRQWIAAKALFTELLSESPNRRIYAIYLERIQHLSEQILPDDWDGTFIHHSK